VDVWWNLGQPIPLPDGSCRYIFQEHVLEHFVLPRGLLLLNECHRLLGPGGVYRVPRFRSWTKTDYETCKEHC